MMKKVLFLLGIVILFALKTIPQVPNFDTFKILKNKKEVKVNAIFQDNSGFIWIGTNQGLIKYNGIEFIPFNQKNNLSSNIITAITQDSSGTIWIGHQNGSLTHYDGKLFQPFSPEEGSPTSEISSFLVARSNTIWFTTLGEGVYYWGGKNRKRIYNINSDDGLLDNYAYTIVEGDESRIFIGTDKGICVYDTSIHQVVDSITMIDGLPDNIVKHLCYTPDKKLWIGMEDGGISCYDLESKSFTNLSNWVFGSINNFVIVNSNEFWISTKSKGIVRLNFDDKAKPWYKLYGKTNGLQSNQTETIFLDGEHNIWIGTKDGLSIRKNNYIEFFDIRDNFNVKNIYSITFDKKGDIWVASQEGLFKVTRSEMGELSTQKLFDFSKVSLLSFISVYCDTEGYIWAGTYGYGLYKINPQNLSYKVYTTKDGLANDNVFSINGKNDTIIFSTLGGGISVHDLNHPGQFSNLSIENGLSSNYIYSTFIDSKNRIWFCTDGGGAIYESKGQFVKCVNSEDTLFSQVFYSAIEDKLGKIWLVSADRGVYIYDGSSFDNINELNGLRTNKITGIAKTDDGRIVLVSDEGIDIYDIDNKTFEYWGEEDKVAYKEPNLNAIIADSNGRIWIGAKDGIVIHNPKLDSQIQKEPMLIITSKRLFSEPIETGKRKFSYRQNYFTFHYIGLWYKAPEKLWYRYKLEGLDMDWSAPTRNLQVTYSNLNSGNYRFIVEVSHIPGEWISNDNTAYSFKIRPPFYKTWWFISIFIISIVIGIYAFIKYRTAKLERDKDILEEEVKKRTFEIQMQKEEIEAQRDEIEQQHQYVTKQRDQIASQNRDIKSSIEYASRIQRAILPPEEFIQQFFNDYFIFFNPRDIVSGDFYYFNHRDNKVVFAAVDCTGHGVPGAFMSMLGSTILNDIVNDIEDFHAGKILNELRIRIKKALRQKGLEGETRDGMDISLCIYDPVNMKINFSGAYNPLFLVRNLEITIVNADKMPIGVFPREDEFTDHFVDVQKDDMIYVFSDGYHDQLGGERNTKFLLKNFRSLLVEVSSLPACNQKLALGDRINSWKMDYPQTDDMLIIGVKI